MGSNQTTKVPGALLRSRSSGPTAAEILSRWESLRPWPGGKRLFSWFVGWLAPYTGTIGAQVEELEPGYACLSMKDRRKVRNPFRSIHAVALMNLAEATSGLAMLSGLPAEARAIIVGLSIDYVKKARGTILAEARVTLPETGIEQDYELPATLRDSDGEIVATAVARWRVGPRA